MVPESDAKKKRVCICREFIRSIDSPSGELVSILDEEDSDSCDPIKMERLRRAEAQSRRMSIQQYLDFAEARQVSFGQKNKKCNKFKEWLFAGSRELQNLDVRVDPFALEILCYFAKETVAEIVDLSILIQQETQVRIEDPMTYAMGIPIIAKQDKSASAPFTWDQGIPGLGGSAEEGLLREARDPLHPWHIREAVSRYSANSFAPFSRGQKSLDHNRLGKVLFCV